MSYKAITIADYIVRYCKKHNIFVNIFKLQYILWAIQAEYLVESNGLYPCFDDEIQAWIYGIGIPSVYYNYNHFGSAPLYPSQREPDLSKYIESIDKCKIAIIIDKCKDYSSSELSKISINQKPYKDAARWGWGTVIPKESIYNYFKE